MSGRRILLIGIGVVLAVATLFPLRYEQYLVATGSMAPTILGKHRSCDCPKCGYRVVVGSAAPDLFKAYCPNCGHDDLRLIDAADQSGDIVNVDLWAYTFASPKRWQIALFQRGDQTMVKRIVGLPGEAVEVRQGDLWIDGKRSRKSFAEVVAMKQELFDDSHVAHPSRRPGPMFDGAAKPQTWTFSQQLSDASQYRPLLDEYAYEGSSRADAEPVHDFVAEFDFAMLDVGATLRIALTDGGDVVEAALPRSGLLEIRTRQGTLQGGDTDFTIQASIPLCPLRIGEQHLATFAFVDRRVHIAIDGVPVAEPFDLPDPVARKPVVHPVRLTVEGGRVRVDRMRLARDVHYRPQGMVGQAVRLGGSEYFVLGDHSPVAEDSRNWLEPAVRRRDLLGRVLDLKRSR
ncbi:MAG: S26 family signal peptidase [Gemmataceae bacterium]